ncbi:uncharacterized protein PG998_015208 [Apiospora kogelbergensis]|uniref:uncharacterized protein n=1 Tax=Apiospora kogelbergensis TaxID=1337665 RepID=UPI00312EE078
MLVKRKSWGPTYETSLSNGFGSSLSRTDTCAPGITYDPTYTRNAAASLYVSPKYASAAAVPLAGACENVHLAASTGRPAASWHLPSYTSASHVAPENPASLKAEHVSTGESGPGAAILKW